MTSDTKNVPGADVLITGASTTDVTKVGMTRTGTVDQDLAATGFRQGTVDVAESEVIPVLRETIQVSKREVETGRVVVHKTVSERDEAVEVLLRRTDVSVERVPVGRTVTEAPATRHEGDVMIVPVMEEVLVVEKRLVLKEELHIRKTTSERTSHEVVRLRSEHIRIEPTGSVTVPAHPTQES